MLEIISPTGLILEPGAQSIPVERHNPLFNASDKLFQDITYPGKAPLSPANKAFFQNGHLVEAGLEVYEFPVQVRYQGTPFFTGVISYRLTSNAFDYTLRVNYGAIADKANTVRLPEIGTSDAEWGLDDSVYLAKMYSTLENPAAHNYAFIPVWNPTFPSKMADPSAAYPYVNHFDYDAQWFKTAFATTPLLGSAECPMFKLTYILKSVFEYLGFKATGSFFDDPEVQKIYIYNLRAILGADSYEILPSMMYMPNITIAEFFKAVRERCRVGFYFDLATGEVKVETIDSILAGEVFNITDYVERVDELEAPEAKGMSVVLKPDETDEMYNVGTEDDKEFQPMWKLTVGEGAEEKEWSIGTLKEHVEAGRQSVAAKQLVYTRAFVPGVDAIFPMKTPYDEGSRNTWPLRLIRYDGMEELEPGKFWPRSSSYDLTEADASMVVFENTAKPVTIFANMPVTVLSQLGTDRKIGFISNEGNYAECVPATISFDMGDTVDLIRVKIEGRVISYGAGPAVSVTREDVSETTPHNALMRFKACFPPEFGEVQLEMVTTLVDEPNFATYTVPVIKLSCDEYGVGGQAVWSEYADSESVWYADVKLRSRIKPKYMQRLGRRYYFEQVGDAWEIVLSATWSHIPYWIVY